MYFGEGTVRERGESEGYGPFSCTKMGGGLQPKGVGVNDGRYAGVAESHAWNSATPAYLPNSSMRGTPRKAAANHSETRQYSFGTASDGTAFFNSTFREC